jgi:hypothetical protein
MLHERTTRNNIRVYARAALELAALTPPPYPSLTHQPPNASILSASHAGTYTINFTCTYRDKFEGNQ